MFDWLREIRDNVVAEVSLAFASPSDELVKSVRRATHSDDARMCAAIEDSTSFIGHGRILGEMEEAGLSVNDSVEHIASVIKWPEDQVRETVEAQRIVLFLKQKLYEKDQIIRIGNISLALQRNGGNVQVTATECGADVDSVNAVIQLINEYAASIGGTVVWTPYVEEKSDEQAAPTGAKTTKKTSGSKTTTNKKETSKPFTVAAAGAAQ